MLQYLTDIVFLLHRFFKDYKKLGYVYPTQVVSNLWWNVEKNFDSRTKEWKKEAEDMMSAVEVIIIIFCTHFQLILQLDHFINQTQSSDPIVFG